MPTILTLEYHHHEAIIAVGRYGNLLRAANVLDLSESTLSRRVSELERLINTHVNEEGLGRVNVPGVENENWVALYARNAGKGEDPLTPEGHEYARESVKALLHRARYVGRKRSRG